MTTPAASPIVTIMRNGACQPQRFARTSAIGIPSTWLEANAGWTRPITRPRIAIGNRSATIAKPIDPTTPPKSPVTTRAKRRKS